MQKIRYDLSDTVAGQVRAYRQARQWTIRRLADECAHLGAPHITAWSLGNLERGYQGARRRVLLDEVCVLAAALDVPPIMLLFPVGARETVEILPGVTVPVWEAVRWWIGERPVRGDQPTVDGWLAASAPLVYHRDLEQLVDRWANVVDAGQRQAVEQRIRQARVTMRRAGINPPRLPEGLAQLDEQGSRQRGGLTGDDQSQTGSNVPRQRIPPSHAR